MKVITLLNEKGGVGKTTLALHIAGGLAIRGQKVLLIDADAQAHTTIQLGQQKWGGLYRLLIQQEAWRSVLKVPALDVWAGDFAEAGQLRLLPGNIETRAIPLLTDQTGLLRERLDELKHYVDVVVIDTSPTPSMLHSMIYVATDYMIYPSQAQYLSLDGLAESLSHMKKLNQTREGIGLPAATLAGVVPTMLGRTRAHRPGMKQMQEKFVGKMLPAMALSTVWQDREYARKLLYAYAPEHEATYAMWTLIDRLQVVCDVA